VICQGSSRRRFKNTLRCARSGATRRGLGPLRARQLGPSQTIEPFDKVRRSSNILAGSRIGSRLAPTREGIQEAVESADESGFDLEHVDEICYGIRADLWNAAMPLKGFVEAVAKQVPAKR
jgi:hypothetical protein